MRLGFIGTGVITKAVVTGLLRSNLAFDRIALSPRNAATAAELAALDARVQVCTDNQAVLDTSDVVCLAVVPQIAAEVLQDLHFGAHHHVISFIAAASLDEVARLVQPAARVVRVIPLPAVAEHKGSTAICPADDTAKRLFSVLGAAVEVGDEREFDALSTVTATMASFYAVQEAQAQWLVGKGLSYDAARTFLSGYSLGLAHESTRTTEPFSAVIDGLMTPGGINEQLHGELSARGAYAYYAQALDHVWDRIRGAAHSKA